MLDRINIRIQVTRVDYEKLSDKRMREPSYTVRARVETERDIQRRRFAGMKDIACTSPMKTAMSQLSVRAYHRVLKLARTIADLAEALQ